MSLGRWADQCDAISSSSSEDDDEGGGFGNLAGRRFGSTGQGASRSGLTDKGKTNKDRKKNKNKRENKKKVKSKLASFFGGGNAARVIKKEVLKVTTPLKTAHEGASSESSDKDDGNSTPNGTATSMDTPKSLASGRPKGIELAQSTPLPDDSSDEEDAPGGGQHGSGSDPTPSSSTADEKNPTVEPEEPPKDYFAKKRSANAWRPRRRPEAVAPPVEDDDDNGDHSNDLQTTASSVKENSSSVKHASLEKTELGERLWLMSQSKGMNPSLSKKVVGVILQQFDKKQIAIWFESGNILEVLDGVAKKVEEALTTTSSAQVVDQSKKENKTLVGTTTKPPPAVSDQTSASAPSASPSMDNLGQRLWASAQNIGMDSAISRRVIGIIVSSFSAEQISAWYEENQIPEVLDNVKSKVIAASLPQSDGPRGTSITSSGETSKAPDDAVKSVSSEGRSQGSNKTEESQDFGERLWALSQKEGMDPEIAKKVVGIIISNFKAEQIQAWYEAEKISQVLDNVAEKVKSMNKEQQKGKQVQEQKKKAEGEAKKAPASYSQDDQDKVYFALMKHAEDYAAASKRGRKKNRKKAKVRLEEFETCFQQAIDMRLGSADMLWEWLEGVSKPFCIKVKNKQKAEVERQISETKAREKSRKKSMFTEKEAKEASADLVSTNEVAAPTDQLETSKIIEPGKQSAINSGNVEREAKSCVDISGTTSQLVEEHQKQVSFDHETSDSTVALDGSIAQAVSKSVSGVSIEFTSLKKPPTRAQLRQMLNDYLSGVIPDSSLRSKVVEVLRREHTKLQLVHWMATPAGQASFAPVVSGVKNAILCGQQVGAGNVQWRRPGERAAASAASSSVITKESMGERLWFTCGEEVELERDVAKPVVGILLSNFTLEQLSSWFDADEIVPVIQTVAAMVKDAMEETDEFDNEKDTKDGTTKEQLQTLNSANIPTSEELGSQLWRVSQENGIESSIANKVIGIVLSSFDASQITLWFENKQIPQVLASVEAKVVEAMRRHEVSVNRENEEILVSEHDKEAAVASGKLLGRALKGVLEQPPPIAPGSVPDGEKSANSLDASSLSHQAKEWVPSSMSQGISTDASEWTPAGVPSDLETMEMMEQAAISELTDEDYAAMEEMGLI